MTNAIPPDPNDPANRPADPEKKPLIWKVLKSAIAPDVLDDGGHDAPLSSRGRLLFYGVVSVLVIAIVILLLITVARK